MHTPQQDLGTQEYVRQTFWPGGFPVDAWSVDKLQDFSSTIRGSYHRIFKTNTADRIPVQYNYTATKSVRYSEIVLQNRENLLRLFAMQALRQCDHHADQEAGAQRRYALERKIRYLGISTNELSAEEWAALLEYAVRTNVEREKLITATAALSSMGSPNTENWPFNGIATNLGQANAPAASTASDLLQTVSGFRPPRFQEERCE
jgi:uncharacterized membrane protein